MPGIQTAVFWAELGVRTALAVWRIVKEDTKNKSEEKEEKRQSQKEHDQTYLYYYTSLERAVNILLERCIPMSSSYQDDVLDSDCVFLCSTPPKRITDRLGRHEATAERLLAWAARDSRTWCFEIRRSDVPGVRRAPMMGPDIWLCPRDVHLSKIHWELISEADN